VRVLSRILIIIAVIAIFYSLLQDQGSFLWNRYFPCRNPIEYSLGTFDERFGISRDDFLGTISRAERVWEEAAGRELFQQEPDGSLKINLAYDDRQAATDTLEEIGTTLESTRESYDMLESQYKKLKADFEKNRAVYETKKSALEKLLADYNDEVANWNRRGGAPKGVYAELEKEKKTLDGKLKELESLRVNLNSQAEKLNATVVRLNQIANDLNLHVERHNKIGEDYREFEEGTYSESGNGRAITIYQFSDRLKLSLVLAHELGHALGLGHVEDPKAVMYYLNQADFLSLTSDDVAALKELCGT